MKVPLASGLILLVMAFLVTLVSAQETGVSAEAVGQANVRGAASLDAPIVSEIIRGTRYGVLAQDGFGSWLLLAQPDGGTPLGWVFGELLEVQGPRAALPISDLVIGAAPTNTAPVAAEQPPPTTATPAPAQSTPLPVNAIIGTVRGEINVRYGPGVSFPRVGVVRAGDQLEIIAWHTQFPWAQVRFAGSPNSLGWVAVELLDIQGNLYALPGISQTNFALPTLTPTAAAVVAAPRDGAPPMPVSPAFQALGDSLWALTLGQQFDPATSRLASLYLLDLRTGEAVTFGSQFAFNGMSINKIAILTAVYATLPGPPDSDTAWNLANMMVCSENSASNALLRTIGGGDEYVGAARVTEVLRVAGLLNTYIVAPYAMPGVTPTPVRAPITQVDQVRASPNYANQMTAEEVGWLLDDIYQCAFDESGPLIQNFSGAIQPNECRQMIELMVNNNLSEPLLLSAGVPTGVQVAHKHGWTADTHGAAGIVFTPGGDYVLVMTLHNPTWLDFEQSFPLITEVSRTVYNYFNPGQPLAEPRPYNIVEVADCRVAPELLDRLRTANPLS